MKPSDLMLTPMFLGWKRSLEGSVKEMTPSTFAAALDEALVQPDESDEEVDRQLQQALRRLWFRLVRTENTRRKGSSGQSSA
jgi:hypothetical protein